MTIASLAVKIIPAAGIAYGLYALYAHMQAGLAALPF